MVECLLVAGWGAGRPVAQEIYEAGEKGRKQETTRKNTESLRRTVGLQQLMSFLLRNHSVVKPLTRHYIICKICCCATKLMILKLCTVYCHCNWRVKVKQFVLIYFLPPVFFCPHPKPGLPCWKQKVMKVKLQPPAWCSIELLIKLYSKKGTPNTDIDPNITLMQHRSCWSNHQGLNLENNAYSKIWREIFVSCKKYPQSHQQARANDAINCPAFVFYNEANSL